MTRTTALAEAWRITASTGFAGKRRPQHSSVFRILTRWVDPAMDRFHSCGAVFGPPRIHIIRCKC